MKTMNTIQKLKSRRDELNRELMSLHLQIETAQQKAAPECTFMLNGTKHVVVGTVCGANVRQQLNPDMARHQIYFENTGHAPDILVNDSDPIPNGARLYSIPACYGA